MDVIGGGGYSEFFSLSLALTVFMHKGHSSLSIHISLVKVSHLATPNFKEAWTFIPNVYPMQDQENL